MHTKKTSETLNKPFSFKVAVCIEEMYNKFVHGLIFGLIVCKCRKQIKFCWSAKFWVTRNASVTKPQDEEMFHTVRSGPHTTEVDVTSTSQQTPAITSADGTLTKKDTDTKPVHNRAESLLQKLYPTVTE